jgi:hypothetical protein
MLVVLAFAHELLPRLLPSGENNCLQRHYTCKLVKSLKSAETLFRQSQRDEPQI